MKIDLVEPAERYRDTFLRGLREFHAEGLPWYVGSDLASIEANFPAFVQEKLRDATRRTETFLPQTNLWAISEGKYVGRISIRRELNETLRREGGHIGYDTVPSFRRRGVATEMLRLALPVAHALGLSSVLLTCDDTNSASIRVIEKNGGVLEKILVVDPSRPPKRHYCIALTSRI